MSYSLPPIGNNISYNSQNYHSNSPPKKNPLIAGLSDNSPHSQSPPSRQASAGNLGRPTDNNPLLSQHFSLNPQMLAGSNPLLNPLILSGKDLIPSGNNPFGMNVPQQINGAPVYMQPIIIETDDKPKSRRKKKNYLYSGNRYDDSSSETDEEEEEDLSVLRRDPTMKPVVTFIKHYINRQNKVMNRIMRDLEDTKKLVRYKSGAQFNLGDAYAGSRTPNAYNGINQPGIPLKLGGPRFNIDQMYYEMDVQKERLEKEYKEKLDKAKKKKKKKKKKDEDSDDDSSDSGRDSEEETGKKSKKKKSKKEKEKKKKKSKRIPDRVKGKKLIRAFGWAISLSGLWFVSVVKWAEQRRDEEVKSLEAEVPENLEVFLEFATAAVEKEVRAFATEKESMVLVNKKPAKPKEISNRSKLIANNIITVIDNISMNLDKGKLSKSFFEFLGAISEDDAVIPEGLLSGFELQRLSFNMFSNLKAMNEWRSKMIIANFVIMKGILYFLMMRPWKAMPSIQEKQVNFKNTFNAASVLYHVVLDLLKEKVPIHHSDVGLPFQPTPSKFVALDPENLMKLEVLPEDNSQDVNQIVTGFYSRATLVELLDSQPDLVKDMKEAVMDLLDVLYEMSHTALEKKWHVKQRFVNHRPKKR